MSKEEHAIENCIFAYYYHNDNLKNVDRLWEQEEAEKNNVDDIHKVFTDNEILLIETSAYYVRFVLCQSWKQFCQLLGIEESEE